MRFLLRKCIPVIAVTVLCITISMAAGTHGTVPVNTSPARVIVIDAGHGEPDGGAMGKAKVKESVLNLLIANIVKDELEKSGFSVIMTRTDENAINQSANASVRDNKRADLRERVRIVNESGADALVSIHMNYFGDGKSSGPQVFYSEKTDSAELAEEIRQSFLSEIGSHCTRETKSVTNGIYLLKNAKIKAVLVECGFLSNAREEVLLMTSQYRKKIGKAVADGIKSYFSGKNKA